MRVSDASSDAGDAGDAGSDAGKDVTVDSLLKGRVRLYQPARGARMSLDPVLLAGFVVPPFGRFLDIGAGAGPLSFLLLARDPGATGVAVEIEPRLAALASRGRDDNGWRERLQIMEGDVRRLDAEVGLGGYDLVVTNPPYRPLRTGNVSPHPERAVAHHEVALALGEWLDCAARAVRSGGRVAAILPADRTDELLAALPARGLAPTRLRRVHPLADRPASASSSRPRRERQAPRARSLLSSCMPPGAATPRRSCGCSARTADEGAMCVGGGSGACMKVGAWREPFRLLRGSTSDMKPSRASVSVAIKVAFVVAALAAIAGCGSTRNNAASGAAGAGGSTGGATGAGGGSGTTGGGGAAGGQSGGQSGTVGTGGAGGGGVVCTVAGAACTSNSECCSLACDPVAKTCASSVTTCAGPGSSCAVNTDCCNLQCDTARGVCAQRDELRGRQRDLHRLGALLQRNLHRRQVPAAQHHLLDRRQPLHADRRRRRRLLLGPLHERQVRARLVVLHPAGRRLRARHRLLRRLLLEGSGRHPGRLHGRRDHRHRQLHARRRPLQRLRQLLQQELRPLGALGRATSASPASAARS